MNALTKEIKYFGIAIPLGILTIIIGALTYEEIAAITGVGEPWVAFGFIVAWLLACNRYNARLDNELKAEQRDNLSDARLSDTVQNRDS